MVIVGLLYYLASIILGITAVNYFFGERVKEAIPKYAFGIPIGYALAAYTVLIQEAVAKQFYTWEVASAAVALLVISAALYRYARRKDMFRLSKLIEEVHEDPIYHAALFTVVGALIILQIAGLHMSSAGIVAGSNYGPDFLFHIGIGNSLIYSGFPPTLLYAYNATNVFPFVADFYSSILMSQGVGVVWSTWLMNCLLWFSLATSAIYFISLFLKNKALAVPTFLLFLFVSLGFNMLIAFLFNINLWIFPQGLLQNAGSSVNNFISFLQYPFFNFSDPMVSNFSIQHDYLLGFPFAMAVLSVLYLAFFEKGKKIGMAEMLFLGMLIGLMPLIHPFSLVFVVFFGLSAFAYSLWHSKKRKDLFLRVWLPLGIMVLAFAAPELLYVHSQHLQSGFISFSYTQSFWYVAGNAIANIPYDIWLHLVFWIEAIGLLFILGLIGLYCFRDRLILFVPAFAAFIMVNVIQLQPSFGDSNKMIIYFLLFMAIATVKLFYEITKRWRPFAAIAVLLFFLMTFSALISEYYVFSYYNVITNTPIAASSWIAHNTSTGSVFLSNCVDNTFGFISTLGGRRTVLEYYYYIHDVGIFNYNPDSVYGQVDSYYSNPTCSMVQQYNVSYVALEQLHYFSPNWCFNVDYNAFLNSTNFTLVKSFVNTSVGDSVYILKPNCG